MSVHVILPSDAKELQREDIKSGIFKVLKPLKYKGLRIDYGFEGTTFNKEYDILILALPENSFGRNFLALGDNQNQYIMFCRDNKIPIFLLYKTIHDGYRLYKTDTGAAGISGSTFGRDDIRNVFQQRYNVSLEPTPEPKPEEEAMPMLYRFKTQAEFIADNMWNGSLGVPARWNSDKKMNHLLGSSIDPMFNQSCKNGKTLSITEKEFSWTIQPTDYVLINKDIEVVIAPKEEWQAMVEIPKKGHEVGRPVFDHDAINKRIHELRYHHEVDRRVLLL